MNNLQDMRSHFLAVSKDHKGTKRGNIADQIAENIRRVLSDDTETVEYERHSAQIQLAENLPRYEQAKAEIPLDAE